VTAVFAPGAMVLCLEAAPPRVRTLSALWRDSMPRVPRDPSGPVSSDETTARWTRARAVRSSSSQQLVVIDEKLANATGWHSAPTGNVKMLLNSLESSLNTYFRPSQSRSSFRGVRRPSRRGRSKSCCCAWCCHRSAILTIALVPLSDPPLACARAVGAGRLQAATGAVGHRAARGHHRWGR